MTLTIASYTKLIQEHQYFLNAITNGQNSLNAVIASGQALFADTHYAETFGAVAGYTAYLTQCQTLINTLISSWPAEPAVSF